MAEILGGPLNLYDLLRIKQTSGYDIWPAFAPKCIRWSITEWEMIEKYVKNRPRLASVLVPISCLERFHRIYELGSGIILSDPTFKDRYEFVQRLSPLPLKLEKDEDFEKLLINIGRAYETRIHHKWLSIVKNSEIAERLCINKKFLKSGITYRVFPLQNVKSLNALGVGKYCYLLLDQVEEPIDILGHAAYLKLLMNDIYYFEEHGYFFELEIKKSLQWALEQLQQRLPRNYNKYDSPEGFCYYISSWPRKRVLRNHVKINAILQDFDLLSFERLTAMIAYKIRDSCEIFLSRANRTRLQGIPHMRMSVYNFCLNREKRIDYFHRWKRTLPIKSPRNSRDLIRFTDNFLYNFQSLPLMLGGMSLQEYLNKLQHDLAEKAQLQLDIATESNLVIEVRKEIEISLTLQMSNAVFDYILVSLAKQLYCGSYEQFGQGLLCWIYIRTNDKKCLGKYNFLIEHLVSPRLFKI